MRHTKANSLRKILGSVLSLCRARPLYTRSLCRGLRYFVFVFLTFFSQGARWASQSTDWSMDCSTFVFIPIHGLIHVLIHGSIHLFFRTQGGRSKLRPSSEEEHKRRRRSRCGRGNVEGKMRKRICGRGNVEEDMWKRKYAKGTVQDPRYFEEWSGVLQSSIQSLIQSSIQGFLSTFIFCSTFVHLQSLIESKF